MDDNGVREGLMSGRGSAQIVGREAERSQLQHALMLAAR